MSNNDTLRKAHDAEVRLRDLERSLTSLGLHEVAVVLKDAREVIADMSATWHFSQYDDARRRAESR